MTPKGDSATTLPDLSVCVSLCLLSICVLSCPLLYNKASLVAQDGNESACAVLSILCIVRNNPMESRSLLI